MKIFHVIDSGGLYGAEVMLLSLMQEQKRAGLDSVLISIGTKSCSEKPIEIEARSQGLVVQVIRMSPGLNLWGAYQILNFVRREKGDVIHSHGYKCNILLGFLPRYLCPLPIVTTLHGWTSTKACRKISLYEWLDAKSLRFIDQVVLVHEAMLQHPRLKNSSVNFKIINNGINLDPAKKSFPRKEKFEPDAEILSFCKKGRVVCSIGRLSPEKGIDVLIKAFSDLAAKYKDIQLLIIGEGKERKALQAQIDSYRLGHRIFLPGYRPHAAGYLKFCKLLVIPSYTEGLPITALEAMCAGVPVVASKVGGLPNILAQGQCGILVDPGCSNDLATGIKTLLEDETLRQQMIGKSLIRLKKCYSASSMAEKYSQIYAEVLTNKCSAKSTRK